MGAAVATIVASRAATNSESCVDISAHEKESLGQRSFSAQPRTTYKKRKYNGNEAPRASLLDLGLSKRHFSVRSDVLIMFALDMRLGRLGFGCFLGSKRGLADRANDHFQLTLHLTRRER